MNVTKVFSIFCYIKLLSCFLHIWVSLHMGLLKYKTNFIQIVLMRWINQAFILGPKTWVRLITIKNSLISKLFTKEADRNLEKLIFKRMYEYSKWSPGNFELDFGSFQTISIHQNICRSTFSPLLWSMQYWKGMIFIFFNWSKCRAYFDMKSGIHMEFKNIQNKFFVHMKTLGIKL